MHVYKIMSRSEWTDALASGRFEGSDHDRRDGFIHLSTGDQLPETARKHFSGRTDLVVVAFDAEALGPQLRWEPSRGGALFPHLYEDLPTQAALRVQDLPSDADGVLRVDAALFDIPRLE